MDKIDNLEMILGSLNEMAVEMHILRVRCRQNAMHLSSLILELQDQKKSQAVQDHLSSLPLAKTPSEAVKNSDDSDDWKDSYSDDESYSDDDFKSSEG